MCTQLVLICWGRSTSCVFFKVLSFKWLLREHCGAKLLVAMWEIVLYENNCNYNSCKFKLQIHFSPHLSFLRHQSQESSFSKLVVCLSVCLLETNFLTCYSCSYYSSMAHNCTLHCMCLFLKRKIYLPDTLLFLVSYSFNKRLSLIKRPLRTKAFLKN